MEVKEIFNLFVKPHLAKYGFRNISRSKKEIVFVDKNDHRIFYVISPGYITIYIWVDRFPKNYALYMTKCIDGIDNINKIFRTEGFYYDSEEELLGILELQYEIFESWLMDWIFEKKFQNIDIYKMDKAMYNERFDETDLTEDEKQKSYNERGVLIDEWVKTRFYPKKWMIEK